MKKGNGSNTKNNSGFNFEAQLWAAADKMRGQLNASEYKYVLLGIDTNADNFRPDHTDPITYYDYRFWWLVN